jgi:hypothetical protein
MPMQRSPSPAGPQAEALTSNPAMGKFVDDLAGADGGAGGGKAAFTLAYERHPVSIPRHLACRIALPPCPCLRCCC